MISEISNESINKVANDLYNTGLVKRTLIEKSDRLSEKYDCSVFLKREDQQCVRSFKIRGALSKMLKHRSHLTNGVVCASAGNHAQGVAISSKYIGCMCHIYIPTCTPLQKISRIQKFCDPTKSVIHIVGETFDQCLELAKDKCQKSSMMFIHPFDDLDIIEGQGTIAKEILDEIDPDIILCGVGGGGLMAGTIMATETNKMVVGIEPDTAPSMISAIRSFRPVKVPIEDTFVDGASVSKVGEITYKICRDFPVFQVDSGTLSTTILELYNEEGIICEPAGALPVAGLNIIPRDVLKNKTVVCVISGGNNDIEKYPEIIRKSLEYKGLKHYFMIDFIQIPGQLKKFVENVLGPNDDIVRFEYTKKTNMDYGTALLGIIIKDKEYINVFMQKLSDAGFRFQKLNPSDMAYKMLI